MASEGLENQESITSINVTPFVDVVLVLLVIFMVTAPTLMKDVVGLELPKSTTAEGKAPTSIGIAVNQEGQILINGELATDEAIQEQIRQLVQENPETQVIVSADTKAQHGAVVRAIDLVKSAGATRFAFQIQKP